MDGKHKLLQIRNDYNLTSRQTDEETDGDLKGSFVNTFGADSCRLQLTLLQDPRVSLKQTGEKPGIVESG